MTSPRVDQPWLVPLLLAAGATAAAGVLLGLMLPWSVLLLHMEIAQFLGLGTVLILPLVLVTAIPVAFSCLDSGRARVVTDETDRLLQQKRQGLLLKQVPRVRDSTARTSRYDAAPGQEIRGEAGQETAADVLDRLVRLKRRGAWAPGERRA